MPALKQSADAPITRANSTGQHGALTLYGQPERPQFQWKRT